MAASDSERPIGEAPYAPGLRGLSILLVALALSIGWGVRGNWGHEYGAMIPGALAAMAAVIVSGREDWWRRIAYFAFFGAVGWSFGGSISYMHVISYTHSSDAASVIYGFACLFVIGFLWGAMGGAGTALPAVFDRERLTELFVPLLAVFARWLAEGVFFWAASQGHGENPSRWAAEALRGAEYLAAMPIAQFDTDWLAALLAIIAVGLVCLVRRRICRASTLILYMAVGWWLGFTMLVLGLGLRMTPPRGDNWAGVLGMTIALFAYLYRERLFAISYAALLAGWFGGLGFSGATLIKLVAMRSGYDTNWHSILEQSYGFINGLGIALAMGYLSTRTATVGDEPPLRRWTEPLAVAFTMVLVTWLNISKNFEAVWSKTGVVPAEMYGLSADQWFAIAYGAIALVFCVLLLVHYLGRRIPILPADWLGRSQLFFVIFLWWIVLGNLSRYLPFAPQRLVTEGVIHVNACLATLLALLLPGGRRVTVFRFAPRMDVACKRLAWAGLVAAILIVVGQFAVVSAVWHDEAYAVQHPPEHIRFGPHRTTDKR